MTVIYSNRELHSESQLKLVVTTRPLLTTISVWWYHSSDSPEIPFAVSWCEFRIGEKEYNCRVALSKPNSPPSTDQKTKEVTSPVTKYV